MHLRAIKLRGFKSFPDPVEVRLEPGVAVVVGPNGSGKSNVSDAIVWAAGSLSPSELRAEKPDDVLYAGGNGREPAAFAEVELLFDNEEGDGPLEFSELSIARRLHRGGEGEYLVNRAHVRRTDVVEMLADIGLGGEMHSIIGQGRVEQILSSKPAERRALIEEAAGLGKFKRRRHRAELKLARVQIQAERARDLEDEVRKRLRPLALQASAAERAEKLRVELDGLRGRIASAELERIEQRLAEVGERKSAAELERKRRDDTLSGLLEERHGAEEELAEAAGKHEEATAALYRLRSGVERIELRRERAEETGRALRADAARPAAPPPASTFEKTLAAASGWDRAEVGDASEAGERLELAQAAGLDAVAVLAGDQLWFSSGAQAKARPEPRADSGFLLQLAERADEVASLLDAAAQSALRFEPPLRARVDAGGSRSGELGEELRALGAREAELRRAATEAGEKLSAIAVEAAGLTREREDVLARLPEGGEAEALTDEEVDELRSQIERLERRREALGQVNPLAAEEHAREKERLEELTTQRADLERSLEELAKLRDDLTATVERLFEETYAAVEHHFAEVAGTLFPGGRGRLIRRDGEEEGEEAGIEVELQPAGKRVTRLSLLSGGEKALGAISFLFALFLARPCPFYLLDEVEAALDDTNIGRFVELLRQFSERAQFIVVTHQKRTMEAADILYGVTSWAEFLGDDAEPEGGDEEEGHRGWLGRLRESLAGSRKALTQELFFNPADSESWERVEEALIRADVGVPATVELVQKLEAREPASEGELVEGLQELVEGMMTTDGGGRLALGAEPAVILVVGVNGTGKTTTIGKLASRLRDHGHSVVVAAADTFRAAADEQLEIWANRAGADFVGSTHGADPAAVAFDAIEAAQARGRDVVIVDTAGRLHTQTNLMEELSKIRRVIAQRLDGAPHETLLVVDATTGQNGLQQARLFGEAVQVSGVALTKLDGSAKGGIAVAIAHELGLPVKLVGVGESLDDLQPFDAGEFARALVSADG